MKISELEALVAKKKTFLIKQAKARGIREDFGAREKREIDEAASSIAHNGMAPWSDRRRAGRVALEFYDWVNGYGGIFL